MNAFRQLRRHQHEHAEEHIHTLPAHHSSIVFDFFLWFKKFVPFFLLVCILLQLSDPFSFMLTAQPNNLPKLNNYDRT